MKRLFITMLILLIPVMVYSADTEVQDLTDITTPAVGDDLYIVDDPDVTPASKKINIGALLDVMTGDVTSASGVTVVANDSHTHQGANLSDDIFLLNNANDSTTGVLTSTGFTIGAAVIIEAELETIDGVTAGTAAASKALVLDGSLDIATINSLTATTLVGALTGEADTVTNATLTTALTVNTGTLTLTADAGNDSVLTIGGGAVSVDGSNTGDQTLYTRHSIALIDPVDTDDFFFGEVAVASTWTSIYCKTLVGTVDLDVSIGGADINGTDITCTTAGVLDETLGGDTAGAVGEEVALVVTSVASDPTYLMVILNGTL